MTDLEGVAIVLQAIGAPSPNALDTGGASEVADAEALLRQENKLIQNRGGNGWWFHRIERYEAELPTIQLTVGGSTGTWVFDETVTQAVSGATGKFKYEITVGASKYVYVVPLTGTFNGANNITGATPTTRTVSAVATVTEARQAFPRSFWCYVERNAEERENPVPNGDYLYNPDPDVQSFNWSEDLLLNVVRLIDFDDLPESLADYVARSAAEKFLWNKRQEESPTLNRFMRTAKARANMENNRATLPNVLESADALRVRADRHRYRSGFWNG